MRQIAHRLLTRLVARFRAVLTRISLRRKRAPRSELQRAKLWLTPMETRDHTGNLAGGIALAAFGYPLHDTMDAMALAAGDFAFLAAQSPQPVANPDSEAPSTITHWLPEDALNSFNLDEGDGAGTAVAGSGLLLPDLGFIPLSSFDLEEEEPSSVALDGAIGTSVGVMDQTSAGGAGSEGSSSPGFSGAGFGGDGVAGGANGIDGSSPFLSPTIFGSPPLSTPESGSGIAGSGDPELAPPPSSNGSGESMPPLGGIVLGDGEQGGQLEGFDDGSGGGQLLSGGASVASNSPAILVVASDPEASQYGKSTGLYRIQRVGPIDDELFVYFKVTTEAPTKDPLLAKWHKAHGGDPLDEENKADFELLSYKADSFELKVLEEGEDEDLRPVLYGKVKLQAGTRTAPVVLAPINPPSTKSPEPGDPPSTAPYRTTVTLEVVSELDPATWEPLETSSYSLDGQSKADVVIDPTADPAAGDESEEPPEAPPGGEGEEEEEEPDPIVTVRTVDSKVAEGDVEDRKFNRPFQGTTAAFVATRSGDVSESLTVYFSLSGKATVTEDYALIGAAPPSAVNKLGTFAFEAGEFEHVIVASPLTDSGLEGLEDLVFRLEPPPAAVGNLVWEDKNANGIQDGEPGLANVAVTLEMSDGIGGWNFAKSTTSNAAGRYWFKDVEPGTYRVRFQGSPGWLLTDPFATDADGKLQPEIDSDAVPDALMPYLGLSPEFTFASGDRPIETIDAGFYRSVTIGDRVWRDKDGDGLQSSGEGGFAGVLVNLVNEAGATVKTVGPTDSSGAYLFTDVRPGKYSLQFAAPNGSVFTKLNVLGGLLGAVDNDAAANGKTAQFKFESGDQRFDLDAGLLSGISDYVWEDLDRDGQQDSGEPGVAGVTVTLENLTTNDVQTTTTDSAGKYLFDNVTFGNSYRVGFDLPGSSWKFTDFRKTGVPVHLDSDAQPPSSGARAWTPSFVAPHPDGPATTDAGMYRLASFGGKAWLDKNGDGVRNVGEPPIVGATVSLFKHDPATGQDSPVDTPQTSKADGSYLFEHLEPGHYFTQIAIGPPLKFTDPGKGTDPELDSDVDQAGRSATLELKSGTEARVDAGAYEPVAVTGLAWVDAGHDGLRGSGEAVLENVSVLLLREIEPGFWSPEDWVATDAGGSYSFVDLKPGSYQVVFGAMAGYTFTIFRASGADEEHDSDADGGTTPAFLLESGEDASHLDAGYITAVGDYVWEDRNGDGLQDSTEPAVSGVGVALERWDVAADDWVVAETKTTDGAGKYLFTNVSPGLLRVKFTAPSGHNFTKAGGGDPERDSNADSGGYSGSFTISGAAGNTSIDAGLVKLAKVSGRAWTDADGNGIFGSGDTGLDGITVSLMDVDDAVVATATTSTIDNQPGSYVFSNVAPGDYYVSFPKPAGHVFTKRYQGGNFELDSNVDSSGGSEWLHLLSGDAAKFIDAGVYQPVFSIGSGQVVEGNSGPAAISFEVSIPVALDSAVSVKYATADGTASVASGDYEQKSATLTFNPGETKKTVSINALGDLIDEPDETFTVVLSDAVDGVVSDTKGTGTGTIVDDDGPPTVSIAGVQTLEGNGVNPVFQFVVTLSAPSGYAVEVAWTAIDGTATSADGDYSAAPGTITFAPHQTTASIPVTVIGDLKYESDESFTVQLTSAKNATLSASSSATGQIGNDDTPPVITVSNVTANESDGTITFTVVQTGLSAFSSSVSYATEQDSAKSSGSGSPGTPDFTHASSLLTFLPSTNPVQSKFVTVSLTNDSVREPQEQFFLDLSAPSKATLGTTRATGTIDDDDPLPSLTIGSASVLESHTGKATLTFTVTLQQMSAQTVSVDWATEDGTATIADDDYESGSGTLDFLPGELTKTVQVYVKGDTRHESDETLKVRLSNEKNATITTAVGTGTITNDDDPPYLTVNSVSQSEGHSGSTVFTFTISLSQASGKQVTTTYQTGGGTATAGTDYTALAPATIDFAPGVTSRTVDVVVIGDTLSEDDETFGFTISNPVNASILPGQETGTGTIQNDDASPTISIQAVTQAEGTGANSTFAFLVSLSAASGKTITVDYKTQDGTAKALDDYFQVTADKLTFAPGSLQQTANVTVVADSIYEAQELFSVLLENAVNATIATGSASGTIQNDEGKPTITIGNISVGEAIGTATVTATLTGATALGASFSYATKSDTAVSAAGSPPVPGTPDFTAASSTVQFPASTSPTQFVTFSIGILNDGVSEASEQFFLDYADAVDATLVAAQSVVTITDEDPLPTVSLNSVQVQEGSSGTTNLVFTVSLSAVSGQTVSAWFYTSDSTATAGSDYTAAGETVTFAPGETTKSVTVAVTGDSTVEPDETFNAWLSKFENAMGGSGGIGTILNDDTPPANASIGDLVYYDLNNSYSFDAGDTVASGVRVELYDMMMTFLTFQNTGPSGDYLFSGLAAGSYNVKFIAPAGHTFNSPPGGILAVPLATGQNYQTADAGLVVSGGGGPPGGGGTASIGDMVWVDDGDGVNNFETPAPGVTVELHKAAGGLLASQTTGTLGNFLFGNLPAGEYQLKFVAPAGYALTTQHAGSAWNDSDPDPGTGWTPIITLDANEIEMTIDAGIVTTGGGGQGLMMGGEGGFGGFGFELEFSEFEPEWGGGMMLLESESDPPFYIVGSPREATAWIVDDDSILAMERIWIEPFELTGVAGVESGSKLIAQVHGPDDAEYIAHIDYGDGDGHSEIVPVLKGAVMAKTVYEKSGAFPVSVKVEVIFHNKADDNESRIVFQDDLNTRLTALINPPEVSLDSTLAPLEAQRCQFLPDPRLVSFAYAGDDVQTRFAPEVLMGEGAQMVTGVTIVPDGKVENLYWVNAPYRYNTPGRYEARVRLRDLDSAALEPGGVVVGTGTREIVVGPTSQDGVTIDAAPLERIEGQEVGSEWSVTVEDEDLEEAPLSVRISWGDGSFPDSFELDDFTLGTPIAIPSDHTFERPGNYGVVLTVLNGPTAVTTIGTSVVVRQAAQVPELQSYLVGTSRFHSFRIGEAKSADADDLGTDYQGVVAWGDGTLSSAVLHGSGGEYWIEGDHAYGQSGRYKAVYRFWQPGNVDADIVGSTIFTVVPVTEGDAHVPNELNLLRAELANGLNDLRGWTHNGTIAEFTFAGLSGGGLRDPDSKHIVGTNFYKVTTPGGVFADAKAYSVFVEPVKEENEAPFTFPVIAADRPLTLEGSEALPKQSVNMESGPLAVMLFSDADSDAIEENADLHYRAVIDWGDGSDDETTDDPEQANIVQLAPGIPMFTVMSEGHVYEKAGSYMVTVFLEGMGPDAGDGVSNLVASIPIKVESLGADAYQRRDDRDESAWITAGPTGAVSLNTGAVRLEHGLDFDISPGTSIGLDPHLVYNSSTVDPRPVIEVLLPASWAGAYGITATLTWDGDEQDAESYLVEDLHEFGIVSLRPEEPVEGDGVYPWTVTLSAYNFDASAFAKDEVVDGIAQVVDNTYGPYGAGWSIDELWRIVPNADGMGGALLIDGGGSSRYFQPNGFQLLGPPEEPGTLMKYCDGFEYRLPSGLVRRFDPTGRLLTATDRKEQVSKFEYQDGRLSKFTASDANEVTLAYDNGTVTITESGDREVMITLSAADADGVRTVDEIDDPDNTDRAFAWQDRYLTEDTWGQRVTQFKWHDLGYVEELTSSGSKLTPASAGGLRASEGKVPDVDPGFARVHDALEHKTKYEIDALGREGEVEFADKSTRTTTRDRYGRPDRVTDELGHTTDYDYNRQGLLTRVKHADGGSESYGPSFVFDQPAAVSDSYGHTTNYAFDKYGNIKTITDPLGNKTIQEWSEDGRTLTSATDARKNKSIFAYDEHLRLKTVTHPTLNGKILTSETGYDAVGNPAWTKDAAKRETSFTYDAMNRLVQTVDPELSKTAWSYSPSGELESIVDPRNVTTTHKYDSHGRLTKTVEAAGSDVARVTEYMYDAAGNLTELVEPRADTGGTVTTKTEYDVRNRPNKIIEAFEVFTRQRTHEVHYDAAGNLRWEQSHTAYDGMPGADQIIRSDYTYDPVGRLIETKVGSDENVRTSSTQYDLNGQVWYTISPGKIKTIYEYDALGRLVKTSEAAGTEVERSRSLGYDAVGNVAWTKDANGVETAYVYDDWNRKTSMTEASKTSLSRTTLYEYDNAGRLVELYSPRAYQEPEYDFLPDGTPTHVVTSFAYNDVQRSVTTTEASNLSATASGDELAPMRHGSPVTITVHDAAGNIVFITDPIGRVTQIDYDELGRKKLETLESLEFIQSTGWKYDVAGNVRETTRTGTTSGPGGEGGSVLSVTDVSQYDVFNRLVRLEQAQSSDGFVTWTKEWNSVTEYLYDAQDNLVYEFAPGGIGTRYVHNPFGEVKEVWEGRRSLLMPTTPPENKVGFLRFTAYDRNAEGQVRSETVHRFLPNQTGSGAATITTEHQFDALGRETALVEAAGTSLQRTTSFRYDSEDRLRSTSRSTLYDSQFASLASFWPAGNAAAQMTVQSTETEYDDLGRAVKLTEGGGGLTRVRLMGYSAADNLTWETSPIAYGDYFSYVSTGSLEDTPTQVARVDTHLYDGLNRRSSTVEAVNASLSELGHASPETIWMYDEAGRVVKQLNPARYVSTILRSAIRYQYDSLDQVVQVEEGQAVFNDQAFIPLRKEQRTYDGMGNVIQVQSGIAADPAAGENRPRITDFGYDELGHLRYQAEWIDFPGTETSQARITDISYDSSGNVTLQTVHPRVNSTTDQIRSTKFGYDDLGRKTKVTEAWTKDPEEAKANLGHYSPLTEYEFDAIGNLLVVTDPRGVKSTHTFDVLGRKTRTVEADFVPTGINVTGFTAPEWNWTYDAADRLTGEQIVGVRLAYATNQQAKQSVWTKFDYDPLGRKDETIEAWQSPRERHSIVVYDAADHPLSRTFGESNLPIEVSSTVTLSASPPLKAEYTYDPLGRLRLVKEAAAYTDAEVLSQTGTTRPWTSYEYDALGNLVKSTKNVSDPDTARVSVARQEYDDLFRVVKSVEGESAAGDLTYARITRSDYDSSGNIVRVASGGEPSKDFVYDLAGRKTQEIVGKGLKESGVPAEWAKSLEMTTTYGYNVFGETTVEDPPVGITTTEYDLLGRARTVFPGGTPWHQVRYSYDSAGNVLSVVDRVHPTWFLQDGKGGFPLDNHGHKIVLGPSFEQRRETTTKFEYDPLGRVVDQVDNAQKHKTYRYDPSGRVELVTDRNGKQIYYAYDELGRTSREYWVTDGAIKNVILTYRDSLDNVRLSFEAVPDMYQFLDDDNSRGIRPVVAPDANWSVGSGTWTSNDYDILGRLEFAVQPQGVTLAYYYDASSRVFRITDDQGGEQTSTFDLAGRVTVRTASAAGKAVHATYLYQDSSSGRSDRIRGVVLRNGGTPQSPAVAIASMAYDPLMGEKERGWYAGTSQVLREYVTTRFSTDGTVYFESRSGVASGLGNGNYTATYTYDDYGLGQVKESRVRINGEWTWNQLYPDEVGNQPYLSLDEALENVGYRMPSITGADKRQYNVEYDDEGNITSIQTPPPSGTLLWMEWDFTYDHRNRLVSVDYSTAVGNNAWDYKYTIEYSYNAAGELVARKRVDSGNVVISSEKFVYSGSTLYADLTATGDIVRRYLYGAKGEPLARIDQTGSLFYLTDRQNSVLQVLAADGSIARRYRYEGVRQAWAGGQGSDRLGLQGQPYDAELKLQWSNGRWFLSVLGRSLSEGGPGLGLNPYPVQGNSFGTRREEPKSVSDLELVARGFGNAVKEALFMGRDILQTGVTVAYQAARWARWTQETHLPELRSSAFKGYEDAVRRGDMNAAGEIQARAMLGVVTIGASEPAINAVKWQVTGKGSREEFFESLGGFGFGLMMLGAGRMLGGVSASQRGLSLGKATLSVAKQFAGDVFDMAVPFARQGWGTLGRGVGFAGRGLSGSGNGGLQTNRLSRAIHDVNGTHKTGVKAWAARQVAEWTGTKACFTGRMPIEWEGGSKRADEVREGDLLWSQDEFDPQGEPCLKRVEEVFERLGSVLEVQVQGQVIETTPEHPIYVANRERFVPAGELQPGDLVQTRDRRWLPVERIEQTDRIETVYNFRVADYHTYFVGCDEWGFSVWAHNAECAIVKVGDEHFLVDAHTGTPIRRVNSFEDVANHLTETGDTLGSLRRTHADPPYEPHVVRQELERRYPGQVESTTVPQMDTSLNIHLAGQAHPNVPGVVFDVRGFPIFDHVEVLRLRIPETNVLNSSRRGQMRAATRELRDMIDSGAIPEAMFKDYQVKAIRSGLPEIPDLTWHHHQNRGIMQLVDRDTHAAVHHVGGFEMWAGH